jgi:hypothetical protein
MPSLLEPSRPPGIAALCAWFWSPVVGREWGILWLLPLRRPSHRTSTEQETNCCTGWCDSFVSCRRPKAAGPRAGLWRHGSKQAGAMPTPSTGHHAARGATGGEATGRQRPARAPSVALRDLRIIGRAARPSSGAWINQAPRQGWKPEGRRPVCGAPFTTARPAILPGRRHLHKRRPRDQTNRRLDGLCAAWPNKNAAPR